MNEITSHELKIMEYNFKKLGSLVLLVTNVNRVLKESLARCEKQNMEDLKCCVTSSVDDLNAFYDFYCDVENEINVSFDRIRDKRVGGL